MSEYCDIGIEQQLLGAVLMNNAAYGLVDDIVLAEHFFEPLHRQIWEVCGTLISAGKLCSPVTLRTFLPADVRVGDMGLREYVAAVCAEATTIINAPDFARIVRDLADRRLIIEVGAELQMSKERENLTLAAWAVDYLDGIVAAQSMNDAPAVDMKQAVVRAIDAAAHAFQQDGKVRGVPYGLAGLDQKTLGAMPGQLIVIAGRPGMGKSALALGIARNMAQDGNPVLFWSGEMGDVDLTTRMISDKLWSPARRLTYWQIASGKYREERFHDITRVGRELAELPIRIEQQPGLTVAQIGARARQWKRKYGLKALFVDHLGLVKASGRYAGNKVYETGEITMGLKTLAKELGIPVFLLCQINRGVEQRDDKRPGLSDLRNSGDIEQDADTVMILYRPAYYLAKKEPHPGSAEFIIWSDEMSKIEHRLDVGIEKQRSGPVGTVRLHCDIACNAVRDEISEMDDSLMLPGEKMEDFA
jgi:replicative DNA helicase